jgi:hypothetical protein
MAGQYCYSKLPAHVWQGAAEVAFGARKGCSAVSMKVSKSLSRNELCGLTLWGTVLAL